MVFPKGKLTTVSTFIVLILLTLSCNQISKTDVAAYRILNGTLLQAEDFNGEINNGIYIELDRKSKESETAESVKYWQKTISILAKNTKMILEYLQNFKTNLIVEAGIEKYTPIDSVKSTELSQNSKLFFERRLELKNKLQDYVNLVFDTTSFEGPLYKANIAKAKNYPYLQVWSSEHEELIKGKLSTISAVALLKTCEIRVRSIEHFLISYINANCTYFIEDYSKISVIWFLNSTTFRSNETIELTTGIGEFTVKNKPEFTINGQRMEPTPEGTVVYTVKAPAKKGKYSIPLRIKFWNESGQLESIFKRMQYEVVEDCDDKR